MYKLISIGAGLVGVYVTAGLLSGNFILASHISSATPAPSQVNLKCFDGTTEPHGYGGACIMSSQFPNSATLENTPGNALGSYSGVYISNPTLSGRGLREITQLGFDYTGSVVVAPWSLILSVPVDTDMNNQTDTYLQIDAFYCSGTHGHVDVISDQKCEILVNNVRYANWAELTVENPTWRVQTDSAVPFIDAVWSLKDTRTFWNVSNINFGKT